MLGAAITAYTVNSGCGGSATTGTGSTTSSGAGGSTTSTSATASSSASTTASTSASASTTASSSASTTTSTGMGGGAPDCKPSGANSTLPDSCGFFASNSKAPAPGSGGAAPAGTQSDPFTTIGDAVSAASKSTTKPPNVYVCGEQFSEAIKINTTMNVYGGFSCAAADGGSAGWAYDPTSKTNLTTSPDSVPLNVSGETTLVTINDFVITAEDAALPGGSSIAVLVDQATVTFERCDVFTGAGQIGNDGVAPSDPPKAGLMGTYGVHACYSNVVNGMGSTTNSCKTDPTDSTDSTGGDGGDGLPGSGGDGKPGAPIFKGKRSLGMGGKGDSGVGMWDCSAGGNGGDGAMGTEGPFGAGASEMDLGTLSSMGFVGQPGVPGLPGLPGQGGGGGGGVRGTTIRTLCPAASQPDAGPTLGGASGGGGGSGGCGGKGGTGGMGGGSSFGLVSLNANITLHSVNMNVGPGGPGGNGGGPQAGAMGGPGGLGGAGTNGTGLLAGCHGGLGGQGGTGGPGGGGRGGHSVGVAFTTKPPAIAGDWMIHTSSFGKGGEGGTSNSKMNSGADGVSEQTLKFP